MNYKIVFRSEPAAESAPDGASQRAVGEQVFLSNLPNDAKIFVFYYPGSSDAEAVEQGLRQLGQRTGDNLFVNISSLVDPDYQRAVEAFGIRPLPVIVVTAIGPLAATPGGSTAFVRLDSKALFADPKQLIETVEDLFNLFLGGHVAKAIAIGVARQGTSRAAAIVKQIAAALLPAIRWVAGRNLSIELFGAKIEVKAYGDGG
jgi:hypothetical protein